MSVRLEELVPGAVAIDERGSICVVTEVRPERPAWPIIFVVKASGAAYKGRPETFKAVVGQVDLKAFTGILEAAQEARMNLEERLPLFGLPEALKGLKPGDAIRVRHGAHVVVAVYKGYNPNRPKYPVSYEINGRPWKGTLSGVVGKAA